MINTILRAKHWQLFSIVFGLPFLIYLFMVYQIFSSINTIEESAPDPGIILGYAKYLIAFGFISTIVYWLWYWSIGVGLNSKVPENAKLSNTTFKIFLLLPAIYLFAVLAFVLTMMSSLPELEAGGAPPFNPALITLILPLHFFSIFCIFYCIYFVAKTIKTVELQRKVTFSDFVAEFFLVWFFPIGIWILQPTINKLVDKDSEDDFREFL